MKAFFENLFNDPFLGMALAAILVLFILTVVIAMVSTLKKTPMKVAQHDPFNYVATIVVGLVITVSTGVLGKPNVPKDSKAATVGSKLGVPTIATLDEPLLLEGLSNDRDREAVLGAAQKKAFQAVYTITYLILGFCCLVVFMVPTETNHALVKQVALTTVGFFITIISGFAK